MCKCGILSLLMALAATAQDVLIKPKDPVAAEAEILEILEIFESKLQTQPAFLTELLAENRDGVERLLRAAQKKRPTARPWALDVQTLFAADVFAGRVLHGRERVAHFKHALEYLQESHAIMVQALDKSPDEELRVVLLGLRLDLALAALEAGELELAKKHAAETLRDSTDRESCNSGNIVHKANQILGRCALREGKLTNAKQHLLAAGATPGSPQLNSFGPQMRLARELLERGEKDTVLQYLDLVARFWANPDEHTEANSKQVAREHLRQLEAWKNRVREGKVPSHSMWRPERPPAASIDALLKGTGEPTVEDVLRIFGQADFRNEDDVRAGIRAAADSPASVSYIHLAWSGQSELHKRDFAQFVLSKKRENRAVPVNFHFIDCTPITEDYSALYDLPGWDRKKYGPQGWGEVLWIRNGRVVHFDRIDRFATTDELVARTKALFGADDTDEAPPRPDSKPGSNLKPLDRNRPEHRRAVAAPEEQSPDHPPQAQPLVKMLEAITTGNPAPLKAVFSEPRTKELDPEEDWSDVLKALQQQARVFYGTTKLDLKGFQYEYIGDDKSGRVVFTYRGRLKDSIEVVTQDGKWEISGPTKGFN